MCLASTLCAYDLRKGYLFVLSWAKTLCRYGCIYFLAAHVLVCVDVIVMSSA